MAQNRLLMVIPTLGERNSWLRLAIASVRSQGVAGVTVAVVGPSGSAAESVAEECGARYVPFDRPGQSAAINAVWTTLGSTYEYFAWLGDDDWIAPASLLAAMAYLDNHPGCGAVYGRYREIDALGATLLAPRPGSLAQALMPYSGNYVPQPGSVFRGDAVRTVGYLDESLGYAMDQDLFLKIRQIATLDYLPVELGAIRMHSDTVTAKRSDGDAEEVRVRIRSLGGGQAPLYYSCRPLFAIIGRAYSHLLRRMTAEEPQFIDGQVYISSALARDSAANGTERFRARPAADAAPRSVKTRILGAESLATAMLLRVWDGTATAKRYRALRVPASVLATVDFEQSHPVGPQIPLAKAADSAD